MSYSKNLDNMNRRELIAAGGAISMLAMTSGEAIAASGTAGVIVKTAQGAIRGTTIDGVTGYLGIPYASAPVGALRFMPPTEPKPWRGIRDGRRYGYKSIQTLSAGFTPEGQIRSTEAEGGRPAPLDHIPTSNEDSPLVPHSEDCLFVDVWTRTAGTKLRKPVMVWLHGGGFMFGAGSDPIYTGVKFVDTGDVVLVNVTHRLNVFGGLHIAALGGPAFASSGNVGMQDLVQALRWVKKNIAAFGGDPGNVTIFGESGGGAKVSGLLAMPSAKNLFHKAIVMSGSANRLLDPAEANTFAREVIAQTGLKDATISELQKMDARRLFDAANAASAKSGGLFGGRNAAGFTPVVDGTVIPRHPFDPDAPAISASVPLMVGTTRDEAALMLRMNPKAFELNEQQMQAQIARIAGPRTEAAIALDRKIHPDDSPPYRLVNIQTAATSRAMAIAMAERKVAQGTAPVYYYIFAWTGPGEAAKYRSNHALDVAPLFLNTQLSSWTPPGPGTDAIAKVMSKTWAAFAHNGSPDNPTIPKWGAYDLSSRPTMLLDVQSKVVDDFEGESRHFWSQKD